MFKIMAPVASKNEFLEMAENGSHEYFGGLCLDGFFMNDRSYARANFAGIRELSETVALIHAAGSRFNLTVNNTNVHLEGFKRYFAAVRELPIDNFIVKDLNIVAYLNSLGYNNIHLSTINQVANFQTVAFVCDNFQVKRICLERSVNRETVAGILSKTQNLPVEVEFFAESGGCPLTEVSCKIHSCRKYGCTASLKNDVLPSLSQSPFCAYCALLSFRPFAEKKDIYLKISGREFPLKQKLSHLGKLRKVLDVLRDHSASTEDLKAIRGEKCHPLACYY